MSFTTPEDTSEMLVVLNVPHRISEYELFELFDEYGGVLDLFTPRDPSRGFAFVTYQSSEQAKKAKFKLDGRMVEDRKLSVQPTKDGPETHVICNSSRDHQRRFMDEKSPIPVGRERRTISNPLICYTRSDYERQKRKRELEKLERSAQEKICESKKFKRRDDGDKSEPGQEKSRRYSEGRQADGTERQSRERKPSSTEFQGVHDDQLKQARSEIDRLKDDNEKLQLYLEESDQKAKGLNSKIEELEKQLSMEKEERRRISSKLTKFVKENNRHTRMQDELKRSQAQLQRLGEQLGLDAGATANEDDIGI